MQKTRSAAGGLRFSFCGAGSGVLGGEDARGLGREGGKGFLRALGRRVHEPAERLLEAVDGLHGALARKGALVVFARDEDARRAGPQRGLDLGGDAAERMAQASATPAEGPSTGMPPGKSMCTS